MDITTLLLQAGLDVPVVAGVAPSQVVAVLATAVAVAVALGVGLRGWYDGALSTLDLFIGGCVLFAAVGVAFIPAGFPWALLALAAPILFLSTSVRMRVWHQRTLARLREEEYAKCRRVLARDPRNAAALAQMAELLEADGRLRDAMEFYETCALCDVSAITAQHRIDRLRERVVQAETGQGRCPGCGTMQPLATGRCFKCGRSFDHGVVFRARLLRLPRHVPMLALVGAMLLAATMVFSLAYAILPQTPWLSIATGICLPLAVFLTLYLLHAYHAAGGEGR